MPLFQICDVCDSILRNPVCDKCGYNNYYLYLSGNQKVNILSEFEDTSWLDDENAVNMLMEAYGLSIDELLKLALLTELELDGLTIEDIYTDE